MSGQINNFISNAKIISAQSIETFGELSIKQLNWKPNEKDWSIGQCFEHLIITNDLYFENIQKVADGTHQNNLFSMIPLVPSITAVAMKKVLSPDWGKKMKTFEIFKPSSSDIAENILESFSENQNRFISLMEATKDLDVNQIKVAEPIGTAVNLRLVDAFEVLIVHEKRHFNQAKRVMEMKEFPRS